MFRAPGAYHRRPRGHGHHGTHDPRFLLLISQLMHQVYQMENKPPVTVAVLAINLALHLQPQLFADILQIPSVSAGCLQPYSIVRRREWSRLLWSAFLHGNDAHVYYNMSSLLWKGAQLEPRLGSLRFAALLAELLVVSHGLVVALFYAAARVMPVELTSSYRNLCAVGFSAVLFGLKVVLQFDSPGSSTVNVPILGRMSLPTRHLCWAELLIAQILVPNASFTGHLCGICAGLLHVAITRHLIRHVPRLLGASRPRDRRRASSAASPRSRSDSPPPRPAQHAHTSGYASYDRSHWAQRPYYNSSDPVAVRRAKANRR